MKRFTKIMQDQGQPTLFVCHTSGGITLPTLSFCDAYLDAEHLTGCLSDRSFLDMLH